MTKETTIVSDIIFHHIVHISDIHIRLSSRFDEYDSVLQRFLQHLKTIKKAIVVITGDVFHHKNELTPDCIMFTISFFRSITKIHPLVIIPGNHDFLMNNLDKSDSITSVLHRRNLKNVFYLKESGVYRFGNLVFVHNSLWNPNQEPWIHPTTVSKQQSSDLIVSLYHGMVGKCQTLSGYTFEGAETLSLSQFDGSDFVLLGDIHHHQYLKENVAYAGSFISQNFNETGDDHGFILWSVKTKTSSFHKLENDYAYRRLDIFPKDGHFMYVKKLYDDLDDVLSKLGASHKLEVHIHDDTSYDCLPLRKKCNAIGIHPRIRHDHTSNQLVTTSGEKESNHPPPQLQDFRNPHSLQSSLKNYLMNDLRMDESKSSRILESILENVQTFQKHGNVKSETGHEGDHGNGSWKLLDMSFDFLFGYGKGNQIVFQDNMAPQLVGIFGGNSVGKSTIIDILLFMFYGKITRYACGNSIPREIIHEKEDHFHGRVRFQVGSDMYTIDKKGQKNKKSSKIKIVEELWKESKGGGKRICLTDEHRLKTDKIVRELIGPMDQFIYMSLCTQVPSKPFREMTQKERKEFLFLLFELDSFEVYHGTLNTQVKQLEVEQKALSISRQSWEVDSEEEWSTSIASIGSKVEACTKKLCDVESQRSILEMKFATFSELQSRCTQLQRQFRSRDTKMKECRRVLDASSSVVLDKDETQNVVVVDVQTIQKSLNDKRARIRTLREEMRMLRTKWKRVPPAPECIDFSFHRYKKMGRRTTHCRVKDTDTAVRFQQPEIPIPDDFSFFNIRKVIFQENEMSRFGEYEIPNIISIFEKISRYESRIREAEVSMRIAMEEYKVHQDVEYSEQCEKCRTNPFRQRKKELEMRMKKAKHEIKICEQKILAETSHVSGDIMTCMTTFHNLDIVKKNACCTFREWTQEGFQKVWSFIRMELQDQRYIIDSFKNSLTNVILDRKHKVDAIVEKEFAQSKNYLNDLNTFLSARWSNVLVERSEKIWVSEMENLEVSCDGYEKVLHRHSQMLQKQHLQLDLKRMEMEELEDRKLMEQTESLLEEFTGVESNIQNNRQEIVRLSREESLLQQSLKTEKEKYSKWRMTIEEIKKIEQKIEERKSLMKVCDRSGFPLFILKTIAPTFNEYINKILHHFIDRYVTFAIDEEGEVMFYTKSNDSDMNFHFYGGMESLMIDLATKITFSHFGYCPMASFFVLDENISVLDEYHVQNIEVLFTFLKQHFHHILLISHLPNVKNIVDKDILIEKQDGYSRVDCVV